MTNRKTAKPRNPARWKSRQTVVIRTEAERKKVFPKLKRTKRMKPVTAWAVVDRTMLGVFLTEMGAKDAVKIYKSFNLISPRIIKVKISEYED